MSGGSNIPAACLRTSSNLVVIAWAIAKQASRHLSIAYSCRFVEMYLALTCAATFPAIESSGLNVTCLQMSWRDSGPRPACCLSFCSEETQRTSWGVRVLSSMTSPLVTLAEMTRQLSPNVTPACAMAVEITTRRPVASRICLSSKGWIFDSSGFAFFAKHCNQDLPVTPNLKITNEDPLNTRGNYPKHPKHQSP